MSFTTADFELALYGASICIPDFDPPAARLRELAELCAGARDCLDAIKAMRDARAHERISCAYRLLHDRRRTAAHAAEAEERRQATAWKAGGERWEDRDA